MKKFSLFLITSFLVMSCQNQAQNQVSSTKKTDFTTKKMEKQTIYQFKITDLNGNEFDFETLKGKKILIVNTASECGLTPQYKDLESIYGKYKDKNFVIVGFPANNFGAQEPGSNEEIGAFCKKNYG
ncbi:MAG TPA: glutathione peroxidase, partial [Flavobacterium sp.]|nr:glutathione peroxidase [Flavobacterium sp.]